jgi:hypothetical protein
VPDMAEQRSANRKASSGLAQVSSARSACSMRRCPLRPCPPASRRIRLKVPRYGIAEDGSHRRTRLPSRAPAVSADGDVLLPNGDFLCRQGREAPVAESGENVHLDHVPVRAECVQFQVERREPPVHPLCERDPPTTRIDVSVVPDSGFLVTTVVLRVFPPLEAWLGFQGSLGTGPAGAPQVAAFSANAMITSSK